MGTRSPTLVSPFMAMVTILGLPQASLRASGVHRGCHVLSMVVCGDSWWCFLGRGHSVVWGPVSLGCEVTLSPESQAQLALV